MFYDPVKDMLGGMFTRHPFLRRVFYRLLDALLLRSWHMHREIKIWSKEHKKATHILDAGCGFGQYSYFLHKLNPRYSILGLDIKGDLVCRCNSFYRERKISNVYFKTGDINQYRQESAFDLVVCADVLEYVEDENKVFKNVYESLKENGIFLMSVPTDGKTMINIHQFRFREEGNQLHDGYNMSDLKIRLKKVGFKKVRARYTYGKPGQISWMLSTKWPVELLRLWKGMVVLLPIYFLLIFPVCLILNFMDTHMGHLTGAGLILKGYK
ncbi:MAG: methyltransferase domain-containing protein [Bacteroidetes bacterium]|nr:methyltransferase domain-containing protein [Bacteroidota bacterium]